MARVEARLDAARPRPFPCPQNDRERAHGSDAPRTINDHPSSEEIVTNHRAESTPYSVPNALSRDGSYPTVHARPFSLQRGALVPRSTEDVRSLHIPCSTAAAQLGAQPAIVQQWGQSRWGVVEYRAFHVFLEAV